MRIGKKLATAGLTGALLLGGVALAAPAQAAGCTTGTSGHLGWAKCPAGVSNKTFRAQVVCTNGTTKNTVYGPWRRANADWNMTSTVDCGPTRGAISAVIDWA
ncbi:hypothetical protein [Streptomyces indicus]|uniref:Uncharacterized protein n=1 Tax=Streptomyces indicus TaxID=417292 RepID=A0A1G9FRE8_9ACTN|nr:hypothetical protein [Streptomyces indicus]SDK90912.1 hypothetical protein SAMN05421806_1147 [Streptomyces indicus]